MQAHLQGTQSLVSYLPSDIHGVDRFAYVGVFVVLWMPNGDCHEISGGGGVAMSIVGYVANGDIHGVDRFVCDRVFVAL